MRIIILFMMLSLKEYIGTIYNLANILTRSLLVSKAKHYMDFIDNSCLEFIGKRKVKSCSHEKEKSN